ncbi:dipeptidase 1-like [Agrilus planipennis]|uniref:Dipeptidase n=1 Tax=Agrilus planipennis TaxID=224129 RepID=A0A1W4XD04_AGRPL|nr:dipeptidase 1-like [Agrilus planipennis]XP_018330313.1 dipeptidase 1-like [Agrilus planipennis]
MNAYIFKFHLAVFIINCFLSGRNGHVLDETPVIDGHNDLPYNLYALLRNNLSGFNFSADLTSDPVWGSCSSCFTDIPRLRKGKVGAQFWVAYVGCSTQYKDALGKTLEQIDVIKRLVKAYPNDLLLATTADDIVQAFNQSKIASLIGVEGGHSMDSRLGVLRLFYELGVRYMTLTHSCNTPWADNSYVDDAAPVLNLTEYGKTVVREMNRLGMMVDLSHVSHAVMNQAIMASRAPVIFSHSSSYSICQHNRNVHDDTLQLLRNNNGIIMVNFYSGFVNNNATAAELDDIVRHINYIVDQIGVEYVGIGADYDGVDSMPRGLEDVSKYPVLFDRLQQLNSTRWTNETLQLLAGRNFLRVFYEVERVRDNLANEEPYQEWISYEDLDAVDNVSVWNCRTLLNNTSPSLPSAQASIAKRSFNGVVIFTVIVMYMFLTYSILA